jgi:NAD(P)H-dependent FMN reductase
MTPTLQIVIASTRPGRVGPAVAEWVREQAETHGGFVPEIIDLAEVDLPFFNEPSHPRFGNYVHPHTLSWSATVQRGDAFVFVTPEYNHGFPATLKNALDYLHGEWGYKAAGLVSYGGAAAGTRAAQMLKPVLSALRMTPVADGVAIAGVASLVQNGTFTGTEALAAMTKTMLDELARTTDALAALRTKTA